MLTAPQESGSGLASVIGSPGLSEWHSDNFTQWESNLLKDGHPLAQLHAKHWGHSMIDQDQEWRDAQLRVLVTGGELGDEGQDEDEHMDEDGNKGMYGSEKTDLDDDIIPGCCFLDIGIAGLEYQRIWVRADYIRTYGYLENYNNKLARIAGRAPAAVITGQPGIGEIPCATFITLALT